LFLKFVPVYTHYFESLSESLVESARFALGIDGAYARPVKANRFVGAIGQFFDGAAGHENGGQFRHVGAVAGGVTFDDERVLSHGLKSGVISIPRHPHGLLTRI
jgi:hypothetical protein